MSASEAEAVEIRERESWPFEPVPDEDTRAEIHREVSRMYKELMREKGESDRPEAVQGGDLWVDLAGLRILRDLTAPRSTGGGQP